MSPLLDGAGVELAYREGGAGSAVLLVHGMAADAQDCEPLIAALSARARVVAFDRRGYGSSGAPAPYERTTVSEQAEDVAAVIRALSLERAVLCGADFGALVCLDVALRHSFKLAALVLFEPHAFSLVAEATEALSAQRAELEQALREGGPAAGPEAWLGRRATAERLRRVAPRARSFFADYAGVATWTVTRAQLRGLKMPVAIVDDPHSAAHVRAAGDALAALLPTPRRRSDGALAEAIVELLPSAQGGERSHRTG